jgi:hypothetical protein
MKRKTRTSAKKPVRGNKSIPDELLVYVVREGEDLEWFTAVRRIADIPEEHEGDLIGVYQLASIRRFKLKRELT